ncbi:MAG: hypothetical protein HYS12_27915 [Planctomycetes bacterium]|nr:hypothetical protein [Planctomycetota bacterium]
MSNEQPTAGDGERSNENTPQPNGPPGTGESAEIERLRQALERAERERDTYREALQLAQAERDDYRRTLYAWMRDHLARLNTELSEEELLRLMREDPGLPLEDFLGEVEQAARGG